MAASYQANDVINKKSSRRGEQTGGDAGIAKTIKRRNISSAEGAKTYQTVGA